MSPSQSSPLLSYPAFLLPRLSRLWTGDLIVWSTIGAAGWATVLLGVAILEDTLTLPGNGSGFLEHPAIFIFLIAQMYVPVSLASAVDRIQMLSSHESTTDSVPRRVFTTWVNEYDTALRRESPASTRPYYLLITIGILVFVWNSYQNQFPLEHVGHDFWDSHRHPLGYWTTRLYKFYIWVMLFPAVSHTMLISVWTVRRVIGELQQTNGAVINPYHEDDSGGMRFLIDSVLTPFVPILVLASALCLAAFVVHGKFDVTTLGGLGLVIAFFLLIYFEPALRIHRLIEREKSRQINEIRRKQSQLYEKLTNRSEEDDLPPAMEAIRNLSHVCARIQSISSWPQFDRVVRLVLLSAGSPVAGWLVKEISSRTQNYFP